MGLRKSGDPSSLIYLALFLLFSPRAYGLNLELGIGFPYQISVAPNTQLIVNITALNEAVHLSFNASRNAVSLEQTHPISRRNIRGATDDFAGGFSIVLHHHLLNFTACSTASPCRYLVDIGDQTASIAVNVTHMYLFVNGTETKRSTLPSRRSDYYGLVVEPQSLPNKILLTPDQLRTDDVDLFVFEAHGPWGKEIEVFPGTNGAQKYDNEVEEAEISSLWNCAAWTDAGVGCLYIIQVYAPASNGNRIASYVIEAKTSKRSANGIQFETHIMWMAVAITVLTLSLIAAIFIFLRMRAALIRQVIIQRQAEALAQINSQGMPITVPAGEQRGVTKAQMKRIKIFKFDPESPDYEDNEAMKCSICLTSYDNGDRLLKLPCNHLFHGDCVACWVEAKHRCPLCRQHINDAEAKYNSAPPLSSPPENGDIEVATVDVEGAAAENVSVEMASVDIGAAEANPPAALRQVSNGMTPRGETTPVDLETGIHSRLEAIPPRVS
ncbi:hypothetical protein AAMO2058_000174900 [Amorphochlora amoebiformis]